VPSVEDKNRLWGDGAEGDTVDKNKNKKKKAKLRGHHECSFKATSVTPVFGQNAHYE
jgi:hypothetical protein